MFNPYSGRLSTMRDRWPRGNKVGSGFEQKCKVSLLVALAHRAQAGNCLNVLEAEYAFKSSIDKLFLSTKLQVKVLPPR